MDKVREFVEAFSGECIEDASYLVEKFMVHNDLDSILDRQVIDSKMFKGVL